MAIVVCSVAMSLFVLLCHPATVGDGAFGRDGAGLVREGDDVGRAVVPELQHVLGILDEVLDIHQTIESHGQDEDGDVQLTRLNGALCVKLQMRAKQSDVNLILPIALNARYEGRVVSVQVGEGDELEEQLVLKVLLLNLLVEMCRHGA